MACIKSPTMCQKISTLGTCIYVYLFVISQVTDATPTTATSLVGNIDELVNIHEESNRIHYNNGIEHSKLASESQVVAVYLDKPSLNFQREKLTDYSDKSKQSQSFDTHQANASDSSSTIAVTTISSSVAASEASSSQQESSTESSSSSEQQAISSTPEPGWPAQSGQSTSTTTAPWTIDDGPVGSKTSRQGVAVLCGEANANGKSNKKLISDRIVGGHKTEPGEFPFQARLNIRSRRGSGICGGVIMDSRHILTAAHCMTACVSQHLTTATIEGTGVKATIGDHSIRANDGEIEMDVEKIIPHEKYDACNFYANDHDIALIKTTEPIEYRFTTDGYGSINRPCMPNGTEVNYREGEQVIVSGWGVTRENSGALSNILRYVQVPIVDVKKCQETYGSRVTQDHVCAGLQSGGKDSCQGDSGGPLVRVVDNRYELVGIVSFGYGCGQPSAPGVYTRVASYVDWIKSNLGDR